MFEQLRPHPRLHANISDFDKIIQLAEHDEFYRECWTTIKKNTDTLPSYFVKEIDVPEVREIKKRVLNLAFTYQITKNPYYAKKALEEILSVCEGGKSELKDWKHHAFLVTGELATGIACGYDWIAETLSVRERNIITSSLKKFVLEPALETYLWYFEGAPKPFSTSKDIGRNGWVHCKMNWNVVCNAGVIAAALSIAEDNLELARKVISFAVKSIKIAMDELTPEGGWEEGPTYWHLTMDYFLETLSSLKTSIGNYLGLDKCKGLDQTWKFPLYMTGPNGLTFDFSDCGPGYRPGSELLYLARLADNYQIAKYRYDELKQSAYNLRVFDMLWYFKKENIRKSEKNLETDIYFPRVEAVTFRSSWNDPHALFFGIKAGDNKANHADLDAGSFVLDSQGTRWFCDLGSENYSIPKYWLDEPSGSIRWKYYRKSAQGHNTIVLNPEIYPDQDPTSFTCFTQVQINCPDPRVTCDLTPAYVAQGVNRYERVARLVNNRQTILLEDQIMLNRNSDVWWSAHTTQNISINDNGKTAVLSCGEKKLFVEILNESENVKFSVMDAVSLPNSCNISHPLEKNRDHIRKLVIKLTNIKVANILVKMHHSLQ